MISLFIASLLTVSAFADICGDNESHIFIPLPGIPSDPLAHVEGNSESEDDHSAKKKVIENNNPMYLRVHPTGNYVIASFGNGTAGIYDIRDPKSPKLIESPLRNESYPLEPSWDLVSSPLSDNGMEYYRFEDLIKKGRQAKPVFSDYHHNEFYQSLAEYPDSTSESHHFRTVLYSTLVSRDYRMKKNEAGEWHVEKSNIMYVCENLKNNFLMPILSKDGKFLSAQTYRRSAWDGFDISNTKVMRIAEDGKCTVEHDLNLFTGKVSFAYPNENGDTTAIAYSSEKLMEYPNGTSNATFAAYIYDLKSKTTKMISRPWLEDPAMYPNFTKDGRVIYTANINGQAGFVIADPKKIEAPKFDEPFAYGKCPGSVLVDAQARPKMRSGKSK